MVDGAKNLALWVGSGGEVVEQSEAQHRANICSECPMNQPADGVTSAVATATRKFLEFKNNLNLTVEGEERLHHCLGCGCVLRLLIWEPGARITKHMTGEELAVAPSYCWKRNP